MKVCALLDVLTDLPTDADGNLAAVSAATVAGYAVFDGAEMVSPVYSAYAHAQAWIDEQGEGQGDLTEF